MSDTTVTTDQARKDIVSPTRGKYHVHHQWVIDTKTLRPVGVRLVHDTVGEDSEE